MFCGRQPNEQPSVPEGAGVGGQLDFEAPRLGDVLAELKASDVDDWTHKSTPKAAGFEKCAQLTRMNLESRRSQLVMWWGAVQQRQAAHNTYLQLPPRAVNVRTPDSGAL